MSGPKCSTYRLTGEQQRIIREQLERERREHEERERVARLKATEIADITAISNRLEQDISGFGKALENAKEIEKLTKKQISFINDVELFRKEVQTKIKNILIPNNVNLEVIQEIKKNLEAFSDSVKLKYNKLVMTGDAIMAEYRDLLLKNIEAGFSFEMSEVQIEKKEKIIDIVAINELTITMLNVFKTIKNNMLLPDEMLNEIEQSQEIIVNIKNEGDLTFLKNYKSVTFAKIKDSYEEIEKLIIKYMSLCKMLGVIAIRFKRIDELKNAITILENQLQQSREQEYISNTIDEVMIEMGYELLGDREITKKSGKKIRNELYMFEDDTAVNITYSSDGKITMEVGGTDKSDRLPTSYEAEKLTEKMEEFCIDYTEIEKRLQTRGVLIGTRISHLPPIAENAQIINITEYNIKDEKLLQKSKKKKIQAVQNKKMTIE